MLLSCPAVLMHQHLLRDLDERIVWHRNSTSGSSRIASSASLTTRMWMEYMHTYTPIHPLSISSQWSSSLHFHPPSDLGIAALIPTAGLHRGLVRTLSLVCLWTKPTPFRTLPRTDQVIPVCLASGLSSGICWRSPEPGCVATSAAISCTLQGRGPVACKRATRLTTVQRSTRCHITRIARARTYLWQADGFDTRKHGTAGSCSLSNRCLCLSHQKWPTKNFHSMSWFNQVTQDFLPI